MILPIKVGWSRFGQLQLMELGAMRSRFWFVGAVAMALNPGLIRGGEALSTPEINKPLIAYWTFDEGAGKSWGDLSGRGCVAALEKAVVGVTTSRGVHGSALSL